MLDSGLMYIYEKRIDLSGNEVYYTISLILLVTNM